MDDKKKISIGGLRISAPVALIVGIILLFIPTYIAVLLWAGSDDEPLVTKSVSEAVITLPSGETMNSAPSGDNAELLDLLLKMNEKGRSVSSLPNTEELGLQCFKVGYTVYGRQSVYDYYLGENPSECYFVSSYGNTYKIDPESASAFLQLPEAESVYGGSAAPVLTAMGKEITAQAVNWNYKTYNGEYRSSASSFENNYFVNDAGELSLNFGCNFSREPDTVSVTIVDDGGNQIYSGGLTGMAEAVDLDDSVNVVMTISAGWAQAGGVACYGETVYQLRGVLHAPPEFYLNRSEISEGGMVVLSGVNVLNPEGCSISVAPSDSVNYAPYTYKPSFYRDGDHVRALIPVSKDLQNGTCGYTVTVTVENTVYTMNFTATKAEDASPASRNIGNEIYVPADTEVKDDPYADLYTAIGGSIAAATDFSVGDMSGAFADSCQNADGVRGVYGTYITYTSIGKSVLSHDNCWVGGKNTSLHAMHRGKVVYVGSMPYTGGLVVIDHGFGLLSWYWNLSKAEATVVVGATVETGDKIGNITGSSFSEVYSGTYISAHTALTVFGTPVNSRLFADGVSFADDSEARVIATSSALTPSGDSDGAQDSSAASSDTSGAAQG